MTQKITFGKIGINWDKNIYDNPLNTKNAIYMLTFKDNSVYIGKAKNLANRIYQHCTKFKKGKTDKDFAIKKYRGFNLDVIDTAKTDIGLSKKEKIYINSAIKLGYNVLNERKTSVN